MRALIIDNEKNIIEGLISLLSIYCPQIRNISTAMNIKEGLQKIESSKPDIVFLDVELDEGTGMDLLDQVQHPQFRLIFITAYNHYAIDAFKHNAIDYLLKPIDPDDLMLAIEKAEKSIELNADQDRLSKLISSLSQLKGQQKKLILNDKDSIHSVEVNNILYLQADGPYTRIVKKEGSLYISKNLKYFEGLLLEAGFYRVHHSFLANLNHLKRYDKSDSQIEFKDGTKVPVSIRKKDGLLEQMRCR